MAIAWLLRLPSKPLPILGSMDEKRLRAMAAADSVASTCRTGSNCWPWRRAMKCREDRHAGRAVCVLRLAPWRGSE